MNTRFQFEKKKTLCPCGQSSSFHAIVGYPDAGKCFSHKCNQRFIPPKNRNRWNRRLR